MARRSSNQAPSTTDEATEPTTDEVTETTAEVEATTDDGTAEPTEATEAAAQDTEKAAEPEVDLTPFREATEAAISEADASTGDLPKIALDSVNKAYRELPTVKGKNAARSYLDESMKAAITSKDIVRARAFVDIKDNLSAAGGSTPKAPADPTEAYVKRVVALTIARNEVLASVPEGVDESWGDKSDDMLAELSDQVEAFRAYQANDDADAEAPEVDPVVRQAFKLAAGKASGGGVRGPSNGPRRDIGKHLEQVFADLEPGAFLTVAEIAKTASTEYGDDRPSAGAVSARLFPKGRDAYKSDTIEASAEEGKSRGAVKLG